MEYSGTGGTFDVLSNQAISHNNGLYYGFKDAILHRLVTMHQVPGIS